MNNPRLALALVLATLCTPIQRLSAQSDVAFPPEVYAARRARLAAQAGDALVIVPGRYSIGDEDLYKPDPNFWYLTGVVCHSGDRAIVVGYRLICAPRFSRRAFPA